MKLINSCNPPERARMTIFPAGGHNMTEEYMTINLTGLGQGLSSFDPYNENIYDWLLAHTRTAPSPLSMVRTPAVRAMPPLEQHAAPAAGVTFTVTPPVIALGGTATLKWSAPGAASCLASGDWVGRRPSSSVETFTPPASGSYGYVLTCAGPDGRTSQSVILTVGERPSITRQR